MRSIEPDELNRRIIILTSQSAAGLRYYALRQSLSSKADILSHRLKRMLKAGLLGKAGSGRDAKYYATEKGLEFLKEYKKPKRQNVNGTVSKSPQNVNEVRDYLKLYYPLAQPIGKPQLRLCLQLNAIGTREDALGQLHFKYNLTAELYDDYLMLYSPELKRSPAQDAFAAHAQLKALLDQEALKIEQLFRASKIPFSLQGFKDQDGNQILISYVSKQEMAHEQHPIAEATKGLKNKIVLNRSHIDGKEETIIDASKLKEQGFKELEAVHRVTAPEVSDIIDKQLSHIEPPTQQDMDAWLSGRIKWSDIPQLKEGLGKVAQAVGTLSDFQTQLASSQLQQANNLNYYAEQIAAHSKAIEKLNKVLDKLDRVLSQRKLSEWG